MKELIQQFTSKDLSLNEVIKIKNGYFLAGKELLELKEEIRKKCKIEPEYVGELIAVEKKGRLVPTLTFIERISRQADIKIFVDDKAAWLFMCGKDIFRDSIKRINYKGANVSKNEYGTIRGVALVFDQLDACLGYGIIINRGKIFLKNILDKGDYLRREMDTK